MKKVLITAQIILSFFKDSFLLDSGNFVFLALVYGSLHAPRMCKKLNKCLPFAGRANKQPKCDNPTAMTSFCKKIR